MPTCATCGQENPDIAKFCLACGAPITTRTGHCHWLGLVADTPQEVRYYQHGGILPYVLRQLLGAK